MPHQPLFHLSRRKRHSRHADSHSQTSSKSYDDLSLAEPLQQSGDRGVLESSPNNDNRPEDHIEAPPYLVEHQNEKAEFFHDTNSQQNLDSKSRQYKQSAIKHQRDFYENLHPIEPDNDAIQGEPFDDHGHQREIADTRSQPILKSLEDKPILQYDVFHGETEVEYLQENPHLDSSEVENLQEDPQHDSSGVENLLENPHQDTIIFNVEHKRSTFFPYFLFRYFKSVNKRIQILKYFFLGRSEQDQL